MTRGLNKKRTAQTQFISSLAGICCPEGMEVAEACHLLVKKEKKYFQSMGGLQTVFKSADRLRYILVTNPSIEVFTIDNSNGRKQLIGIDYMRVNYFVIHIVSGYIVPSLNFRKKHPVSVTERREYIFVNRTQFDDFLNDRPITQLEHQSEKLSQHKLSESDTRTSCDKKILHEILQALVFEYRSWGKTINRDILYKEMNSRLPKDQHITHIWVRTALKDLPLDIKNEVGKRGKTSHKKSDA